VTHDPVEARDFYDELAAYYDLIFEDWDASMVRQGAVLARLIDAELGPGAAPESLRILDAASGIGTQALALAARGFQVTARDISGGAIARLRREAGARGLRVDAAVADMRAVGKTVTAPFDVVLAFDNAVPHLLSDADVELAFRQFHSVLRPGGALLCSVRDYDTVERGVPTTFAYGQRRRAGVVFRVRQEWTWEGTTHYRVAFIIDRDGPEGPRTPLRTVTRYYAVSIPRLLDLMVRAGFVNCRRQDETMYQPIVIGRAPTSG
jgi:SAM-dependent methyltransferase